MKLKITERQKRLYQDEGYLILERVIPDHFLTFLQEECQFFIDQINNQMDQQNTDSLGINHRHKRYFIANCFRQQPKLRDFLFSDLIDFSFDNPQYLFY